MCRILRLPLNAELPMTCMTCEREACGRVPRTFRSGSRWRTLQVPVCGFCKPILASYPGLQRMTALLTTAFFIASIVLFCLDCNFLASLALLGMIPAGLHFVYYHWRFERDCLGIGKNFLLVRVHSKHFAAARDASLKQEEFADWYERLRCEGLSQNKIGALLEGCGLPSRDVYDSVADAERRRRSFYRIDGLRRFMLGSGYSLLALALFQFFLPLIFVWSWGLRPMLGGMRQMVMGTGTLL